MGGETSSQLQVVENAIKIVSLSRGHAESNRKRRANEEAGESGDASKASEAAKKANASNGGSVLLEVRVPQALAVAAGDAPEQH